MCCTNEVNGTPARSSPPDGAAREAVAKMWPAACELRGGTRSPHLYTTYTSTTTTTTTTTVIYTSNITTTTTSISYTSTTTTTVTYITIATTTTSTVTSTASCLHH